MKVLVFSDSHGRVIEMFEAVERDRPDAVIHLGDCYEDACDLRRSYPNLTVYAVTGTNDWGADGPAELVIEPAGVRIYLTHGHREGVAFSSSGRVPVRAAAENCRLALFGHSHVVSRETHGGVLVLNPGSISLPRRGPASYARLILDAGEVRAAEVLDTEGRPWQEKNKKEKKFRWF